MGLTIDKCTKITFRGGDRNFNIIDQKLDHSKTVKDRGIHVPDNLTWKIHIEERLRKANSAIPSPQKRCIESADTCKTRTAQVSHLASLVVAFSCVFASRADLHLLEVFQKVLRGITGNKTMSYRSQLKILNILPLPMFLQFNYILLLSKITHEKIGTSFGLPERPEIRGRKSEIFKLWKTRTVKARSESVFRNCRLVNRLDDYIDFLNPQGLKNRLLKLMWKFVNEIYSESNVCTWQLSCDCPTCRNKCTLF